MAERLKAQVDAALARSGDGSVPEVLPAEGSQSLQQLYVDVLRRVYAIPEAEQTQAMKDLLVEVNDRLDQVAGIGRYAGMRAPRNSTAIINALKTRIILTLGPQVQRSQVAERRESHQEIVIRHVDAGSPESGKPN